MPDQTLERLLRIKTPMLLQTLHKTSVSPWIPDELHELTASLAFRFDLKFVIKHDEVEHLAFGARQFVPI